MKNHVLSDKQLTKMVQQAEAEFENNIENWIEEIEELVDGDINEIRIQTIRVKIRTEDI